MKTLLQYYRDWLANNWRYRGGEGTRTPVHTKD